MVAGPSQNANARAILYMIGAVFCFSVMDVFSKELSQRIETVLAIWARYTGQAVVVTLLILPRARQVLATRYATLQITRSLLLFVSTFFMFFGIARIGLAEATALMSLNPVLITLGAALFLGDAMGPRRLVGISLSLIGGLLIIRPGSSVFTLDALLPLCAAVTFSAYALVTRFVGRDEDVWTSLFYTAALGSIILCCALPWIWTTPDLQTGLLMIAIGGIAAMGQLLLIRALTTAEAGVVVPFIYAGIIFAVIWGLFLFDERPDAMTLFGALVIIGAGLYVWHRETESRTLSPPDAAGP